MKVIDYLASSRTEEDVRRTRIETNKFVENIKAAKVAEMSGGDNNKKKAERLKAEAMKYL
jgi:hypothetical protein